MGTAKALVIVIATVGGGLAAAFFVAEAFAHQGPQVPWLDLTVAAGAVIVSAVGANLFYRHITSITPG